MILRGRSRSGNRHARITSYAPDLLSIAHQVVTANADAIGAVLLAAEVPDLETARQELHQVNVDYLAGKITRDEYQHAADSLNAAIGQFLAAESEAQARP
ncbi:MAG: hypothetical protein ACRDRJ_00710 [Streptosporangiaceae bacterium]